jgi:hypothetical protein
VCGDLLAVDDDEVECARLVEHRREGAAAERERPGLDRAEPLVVRHRARRRRGGKRGERHQRENGGEAPHAEIVGVIPVGHRPQKG